MFEFWEPGQVGLLRKWVEPGALASCGRRDGPLLLSKMGEEGAEVGGARVCKPGDEGRELPHNFYFITEAGDKVKYESSRQNGGPGPAYA